MKKYISLLSVVFLLMSLASFAKKSTYQSSTIVNGNGWNTFPVSIQNQVPTAPVFFQFNQNFVNYRTKTLNSYVKFWLKTENILTGLNAPFTAKAKVQITYYLENPNPSNPIPAVTETKILEINYDPALGAKYKNVAIENYPNASRIDITVLSMTVNDLPATTIQKKFIALQSVIEHERYENFLNVFGQGLNYTIPLSLTGTYNQSSNELNINWSQLRHAEGYELEYAFIDDYANNGPNSFLSQSQINFAFKNNSTRILTQKNSYTIPLVQEHGYLVYRVRGYGMAGSNFDRIFFGDFFPGSGGDQAFNLATFPYKYFIDNTRKHVGDKINWQSVTSFAEEGKSKTVVQYMDGTMRNRQTVTSTSTERNAIVAETIYDFQGRPALNILPAPLLNPKITYYPNFNQNMQGQPYAAANFDYLDNTGCAFNINPLKQQNNLGAANYYSKHNSEKRLFNAFIPESDGYPFTRVTYMPDPTDRVVRQGNVGEIFQPGNTGINGNTPKQNHDTRYFYGKPEQQKLDYLFGTDVGYASFYQKNLVIDPNGQSSISYVDLDGKTIATALAGNSPKNLDPLPSNSTMPINVNLLAEADMVNEQEHSVTASSAILVAANGTNYTFNYSLNANTYEALTCNEATYCLDCIYDLEIKLVNDECADVVYEKRKTIGSLSNLNFLCNDAGASDAFGFEATLNSGSYTITRKLTVNKQAAETYAQDLLNDPNNKCLKTFDDFYKEAWSNRDSTRCLDACESCTAEANANQANSNLSNAIKQCDSLWCSPQIANVCDLAKVNMLNDLSPGGQYAIFKNSSGIIDRNASFISVFNNEIGFGIKRIQGNIAISTITINLPGENPQSLGYYLADNTRFTKLVNNWPEDLSEKLLPLHPEYCYLKYCNLAYVQQGVAFDTKLIGAETYADAQAEFGASVSTVGITTFYEADPFWQSLPETPSTDLKELMKAKFLNVGQSGQSVVQMAIFLANCPSANTLADCNATWGGSNANEEWTRFKGLYYNIKQEFEQKAREKYVRDELGCCPNDYISCGPNTTCPPLITNLGSFSSVQNTYSCFNNMNNLKLLELRVYYQAAAKRFITINDIDFPGVDTPPISLYDMTGSQMQEYLNTDALQNSPCPTCPELEAFKLMIWDMAEKGWFNQGLSLNADAIAGLTGDLRDRFIDPTNSYISINTAKGISFGSKYCNISFTSDTLIDWSSAKIFPTCLEIQDYKHAKLHIIVNGEYKTVLNFTSTCDIFYCEGKSPDKPETDNECKCEKEYNANTIYFLGDIVSYNGVCYILKKVDDPKGGLKPNKGNNPRNTQYWEVFCNEEVVGCRDSQTIDFRQNIGYATNLTSNGGSNSYSITSSFQGISGFVTLPSQAFVAYLYGSGPILTTSLNVTPNESYRLKFDYALYGVMGFKVLINGQLVFSTESNFGTLGTIFNVDIPWVSASGNTAVVEIIKTDNDVRKYFMIDNIQLVCNTNNNTAKLLPTKTDEKSTERYIPQTVCGCNSLCDMGLPMPAMARISCDSILQDIAIQQATTAYQNYRDSLFNAILSGYYAKCLKSIETFTMDYKDAEYHYTLYYYDQSGNLVRTVPPAGVKPFSITAQLNAVAASRNTNGAPVVPDHILATTYRHNSLNAVVWQKTPDAGISEFFYDKLGRIALSQNAEQRILVNNVRKASYSLYDKLGRMQQVGVLVNIAPAVTSEIMKTAVADYLAFNEGIDDQPRAEITKTIYDEPFLPKINAAFAGGQRNLRTRIGTVANFANHTELAANNYEHATHYNYDISGNVVELLQDFGTGSPFGSEPANVRRQSRHLAYKFDLISGNVNEVHYQKNYADQFFYRYAYNADNKLTSAFCSTNGLLWENDARYTYYRHGPLARTEYGTDRVQGIDIAYTLQGWIKGVNGRSYKPIQDMGQDGNANANTVGYSTQNKATAPDVFSYWLSYQSQDYTPIANGQAYIPNAIASLQTGNYHTQPANLYNGNIRSMYTNIQPFGGLGMHYRYDQLNRFKSQTAFDIESQTPSANAAYSMKMKYDPNGNIQSLLRNGTVANPAMDDLFYIYYNNDGSLYTGDPTNPNATNKLAFVKDGVGQTAETSDIEGQNENNYSYDAIGNMISDVQEGLTITYNAQNKVRQIIKTEGKIIRFEYDALGNRIKKYIANTEGKTAEYYVQDASGNPMAIYKQKQDTLFWNEQHLYGSSRLGMYLSAKDITGDYTISSNITNDQTYRNTSLYELTNHQSNALATISDSRSNLNAATLISATDYYAFGMEMPERKYRMKSYRYGYQGQELDNEIEGEGNSLNYKYRMHDPRLGRFFTVDPLAGKYSYNSPYAFSENRVIDGLEWEGLEVVIHHEYQKETNTFIVTSKEIDNSFKENVNHYVYKNADGQITRQVYKSHTSGRSYVAPVGQVDYYTLLTCFNGEEKTGSTSVNTRSGLRWWEDGGMEEKGPRAKGLVGVKVNAGPVKYKAGVGIKETSPESVNAEIINETKFELNPKNWTKTPTMKAGVFLDFELSKADQSGGETIESGMQLGPISIDFKSNTNGASAVALGFGINIGTPINYGVSGGKISVTTE
jgi:RHS repeat-associated protein